MYAQEAMRQNPTLQKLAQLALDEARNNAFALTLLGQEGLEVFGDCAVENAVCRIARDVIRRGVAYGKTVFLTFQLILMKTDSILAYHRRRGPPRLWEATIDLISPVEVEPTFSSIGLGEMLDSISGMDRMRRLPHCRSHCFFLCGSA